MAAFGLTRQTLPPLEIDVYTQVNCKHQKKRKEENLIAFRMMFQDDINLMDGGHMECILGHHRRQFEVKPWSVDLVGQQEPSGQINNLLPVTESLYVSKKKNRSGRMINSVF